MALGLLECGGFSDDGVGEGGFTRSICGLVLQRTCWAMCDSCEQVFDGHEKAG